MTFFPRNPLDQKNSKVVSEQLQKVLVTLIDLSLSAKQAHWNVFGTQFLSVHLKLDDVVVSAREGSDTLAERMVQLGCPADGRVKTVQTTSPLDEYPVSFENVRDTVSLICDRLHKTSEILRDAIEVVGELDPLTEDQLIAIGQQLEEHLWMLQAMEKESAKG